MLSTHIKHVILAVIISITVLLGTYKIIAHYDRVDKDESDLAKAQVVTDVQKAQIQAKQSETDSTDLQNKVNSLVASNQALTTGLANLQSKLDLQKKQDDKLSLSDLSTRWSMLTGVDSGQFVPNTTGVQVTSAAAHTTVSQLEELPVVKQELKSSQDNSSKKDDTLQSQQKVIVDISAELTTCKKTVVDSDNSCKAQITQIKADNRKHNLFYSIISFILGAVVRHA